MNGQAVDLSGDTTLAQPDQGSGAEAPGPHLTLQSACSHKARTYGHATWLEAKRLDQFAGLLLGIVQQGLLIVHTVELVVVDALQQVAQLPVLEAGGPLIPGDPACKLFYVMSGEGVHACRQNFCICVVGRWRWVRFRGLDSRWTTLLRS